MGLNVADSAKESAAYQERYGWTWPQIDDPDRELAGALGIPGQPSVAVLDAEGRVVARHVGGGEREDWEALLSSLE